MDVLRDTRRKQHPSMEVDLRALVEVMRVYRASCLIMDEVDAYLPISPYISLYLPRSPCLIMDEVDLLPRPLKP